MLILNFFHSSIFMIIRIILWRHIRIPLRRRIQRMINIFNFGTNRVIISRRRMSLQHRILPSKWRTLIGQRWRVLMRAHRRPKQLTIVRIQHVGVAVLGRPEVRIRRWRRVEQVEVWPQIIGGLVTPGVHRCGRAEGVGLGEG